jgi:3-mercaptopyruvate sulfurtransferase SseA
VRQIIIVNEQFTGYDEKIMDDEKSEPKPRVNAEIDREWGDRAKRTLQAEMRRRGVNTAQLAEKLGALGIVETDRNVANKISRGGFTTAFFLQCLKAIGATTLHLEE